MTTKMTTYECGICKTEYSDQRSAEKCENQGEPRNRLDLPALFAVDSPNGGLPKQYYMETFPHLATIPYSTHF